MLQMPLEQAFNLIDQALGQLNANRETHALLAASVQRLKDEISTLQDKVFNLTCTTAVLDSPDPPA